jgi:hypothetical protein
MINMKNLSFLVLLISISAQVHADPKVVQKLSETLNPNDPDCGIETKSPAIKKGEVKIAYACADFPIPAKGVEKETITFYEAKSDDESLDKTGLILRSRLSKDDPSKKDVTIKFRPKDQSQKIELEKLLYDSLKDKDDAAKKVADANGTKEAMELKCEADVSYGEGGNKNVNSCSLTTTTDNLTDEHQAFAQMATGLSVKKSLSDFDAINIDSQSWKVKHENFPKGMSVERWDIKDNAGEELCILEVSAKFEVASDPKDDLPERLKVGADGAMAKLLNTRPDLRPLPQQGNKTGKALDFARSAPTYKKN